MQSTSLTGPLGPGVVVPDKVLSMNQIELNCVLKLNWIAGNRTFDILNCVLMLNWIVWNGTVFGIETVLALNWIVWNGTVWQNWIAWNRNVFAN